LPIADLFFVLGPLCFELRNPAFAFCFLLLPIAPAACRLAGMTRLELANQLIEGQPAFHFAFIPMTIAHLRFQIED
jgi:hypothetical protein